MTLSDSQDGEDEWPQKCYFCVTESVRESWSNSCKTTCCRLMPKSGHLRHHCFARLMIPSVGLTWIIRSSAPFIPVKANPQKRSKTHCQYFSSCFGTGKCNSGTSLCACLPEACQESVKSARFAQKCKFWSPMLAGSHEDEEATTQNESNPAPSSSPRLTALIWDSGHRLM